MQQVNTSVYRQDTLWRYIISGCGLALIVLTIAIVLFMLQGLRHIHYI